MIAVLIRCRRIAAYFACTVPRPRDVLIAVGAALVLIFGFGVFAYVLSGGPDIGAEADAYRHYLAAGGTPSGFLLRSYQAVIFAPIVEEMAYRGFLWRGLSASRLGDWGAWLLVSVLFVANHIRDYAHPVALIVVATMGLILGLVRWRTGSTTASMITHSLFNVWITPSPCWPSPSDGCEPLVPPKGSMTLRTGRRKPRRLRRPWRCRLLARSGRCDRSSFPVIC